MKSTPYSVSIPQGNTVSASLLRPVNARVIYVLGHGAGAGMRHPFLETVAVKLGQRGIATFRYQFPYMEAGRKSPDTQRVLEATTRAAMAAAAHHVPDLPLVAGGKSLGGRISSHVAATDPPPGLRGLIFLGFPLHAPKRPDTKRAEHLERVTVPMLFVQGSRDDLADLDLLMPIVRRLGVGATLHVVEGGDHSFNVSKRSGTTIEAVLERISDAVSIWTERLPT